MRGWAREWNAKRLGRRKRGKWMDSFFFRPGCWRASAVVRPRTLLRARQVWDEPDGNDFFHVSMSLNCAHIQFTFVNVAHLFPYARRLLDVSRYLHGGSSESICVVCSMSCSNNVLVSAVFALRVYCVIYTHDLIKPKNKTYNRKCARRVWNGWKQ